MAAGGKATSLKLTLKDAGADVYLIIGTEDATKAEEVAQAWAKDRKGKAVMKVGIHNGIVEIPKTSADAYVLRTNVWEKTF